MLDSTLLLEIFGLLSENCIPRTQCLTKASGQELEPFWQFLNSCEDKLEHAKIIFTNEYFICLVNSFKKLAGLQKC